MNYHLSFELLGRLTVLVFEFLEIRAFLWDEKQIMRFDVSSENNGSRFLSKFADKR